MATESKSKGKSSVGPGGLPARVRAMMLLLRWPLVLVLSVIALVSLNRAIKLLHRLEPPPTLSRAQREASLRVAHAVAAQGSGASVVESDASTLARLVVREPVFVTLYHQASVAKLGVYEGRWVPTSIEPSLGLGRALQRAAGEARAEAMEAGVTQIDPVRVKVDLAGPARALWTRAPWYLRLVLDPGRDGLLVQSGDRTRWFLPSWAVERQRSPASAARSLVRELARATRGGIELSRFRSTCFVDSPDKPDRAHRIVRGNVLPTGFGARELKSALVQAGRYMARMVQSDGTYCYEYSPTTDECLPGYNLLRHAGTTYSLYQVARATGESQLFESAERATRWLRRQVRQVDGDPSRAFLLEGDKAKLGAAGLALIALAEREKALSDGRDRNLMKRLVQFIISQQRPDGSFDSYFGWNPKVDVPTRISIYYPGEAILALVRHHGLERDPRALGSARRGADYLVNRRWRWAGVELYVPPDAWLAQALSELDAIAPEDWLRDYAYEIAEVTDHSMLRADEGTPPDLVGSPGNGVHFPSVTAAGARTEGLSATWVMARRRGETERARRLGDLALSAARFQLSQQFRPENSYFLPSPELALGGFRASPDYNAIRIDTVQHNVSGLLTILEILERQTR
ncbi:MAG: hypothetical protein JW940_05785 [Polyangiaceae bacterium]|nr:hypothetical protein [Polyangiaceae bacterium]